MSSPDEHWNKDLKSSHSMKQMAEGSITGEVSKRWNLLEQFTIRSIKSQYKDSYFGILLSFLDPLMTLTVFTLVFGVIFQSKLKSSGEEDRITFVIGLYLGIIVYQFIAECLARSPMTLVTQPNFVKKVIFPLEILPLATICAVFIQMLMNLCVLFMVIIGFHGALPATAIYIPFVLVPFFLFAVGIGWFFSAIGVFFRDLVVFVTPLRMFLLYASAIFYSIDRVPSFLRPLVEWNPLGFTVYEFRKVLVWGMTPEWQHLGCAFLISIIFVGVSYIFFMSVKKQFAESL